MYYDRPNSQVLFIFLGLIGPYFFENRVNARTYADMLNTFALPAIRELPNANRIWFQQDGAPPHTADQVRTIIIFSFLLFLRFFFLFLIICIIMINHLYNYDLSFV